MTFSQIWRARRSEEKTSSASWESHVPLKGFFLFTTWKLMKVLEKQHEIAQQKHGCTYLRRHYHFACCNFHVTNDSDSEKRVVTAVPRFKVNEQQKRNPWLHTEVWSNSFIISPTANTHDLHCAQNVSIKTLTQKGVRRIAVSLIRA